MSKKLKGIIIKSGEHSVTDSIPKNRSYEGMDLNEMINYPHNLDYQIDNLKDVDKGGKLLKEAIDNDWHIAVVTDYDADGETSAVTLTKGLLEVFSCNPKKVTTILNRKKDGNGFNKTLVKRILDLNKTKKIDLIVAADHGSSNNPEYKIFKDHDIKTLITDHHSIEHGFPDNATVFINPQREDSTYLKSISGCCVAFLLLVRTYNQMFKTTNYKPLDILLPYVAISTITDIMDLSHPFNRHIVRMGLRVLNSHKDKKWPVVKKMIGIPGLLTPKDIGFKLGPVINAGNCTNTEDQVFRMLMSSTVESAEALMVKCNKENQRRKEVTNSIVKKLNKEYVVTPDDHALVLLIETDLFINGKVAPGMGIKYNKPVICFNKIDFDGVEAYSGSGRGIVKGFNILEVLNSVKAEDPDIFYKLGGHHAAVGCTIKIDKLDDFKRLFNKYTKQYLHDKHIEKDIVADMYIKDYMINTKLAHMVSKFEPYGKDWEEPVFVTDLLIEHTFNIGTASKLLFRCPTNKNKLTGVYFYGDESKYTTDNISELKGQVRPVAFKIKVGTFRNSYELSLEVVRIGEWIDE